MKKLTIILLTLILIPLVNAQIAIKSFASSPDKVAPGDQAQLTIILENVGDENIKNILVQLDLSQVPFAPLSSSTEQVIDEIDNDDQRVIHFDLVALPSADSQIYKIPVKISYDNVSKDSLISLEVSANPKVDLILDSTDIVKVNDQGKVTLKFINNGLTQIKFLKVDLQSSPAYDIISPYSVHIGSVDVDDFQTADYTIIPRIKILN